MKPCIKCGEVLSLSQFYRHPQMADGHLNKCKTCTKADVANYRKANLDKVRAYDRQRDSKPHRVAARKAYSLTEAGKAAGSKAKRKYRERNPERYKANTAVNNALRDGRLTRQPCEVCGSAKVHAHHDDYAQPLSVRWLCAIHHKQAHQ